MMIIEEKDPQVFYLLWLSQAKRNLSQFPPLHPHRAWPVSGCPSPMSVLWKYLWNSRINWEWCFGGLLNAQSNIWCKYNFSKIMLNAVPERDVQLLDCRPFQSNGMNTLAEPSRNKHAGRAGGTRWMHRPGETQALIVDLALIWPGVAWMGESMKGLLFSSEEDCALNSLLMLQNQKHL